MPLVIEPMGRHHQCEAFDCGRSELNHYLGHQASQDMRRNVSRVFVATTPESAIVVGYYSLNATSVHAADLPGDIARRLPRYPIPAVLLGRLAVHAAWQGQGLGRRLLVDACRRILGASEVLAMYALIVDAKDHSATAFYVHYGFVPFPETPSRLFLPLTTIRNALDPSQG